MACHQHIVRVRINNALVMNALVMTPRISKFHLRQYTAPVVDGALALLQVGSKEENGLGNPSW